MNLCHEVIGKSIIKFYKLFSKCCGNRNEFVNSFWQGATNWLITSEATKLHLTSEK